MTIKFVCIYMAFWVRMNSYSRGMAFDSCHSTTYCPLDRIYIDYMMHVEALSLGFGFMYNQFIMAEASPRAYNLVGYKYGCRVIDLISDIDDRKNK